VTPPNAVNVTGSAVMTEADLQSQPLDITVELVVVADYELSQVFDGNYERILEYYIPFMWDINMKYKTLPSTRISLQLNGIVVIAVRFKFQDVTLMLECMSNVQKFTAESSRSAFC